MDDADDNAQKQQQALQQLTQQLEQEQPTSTAQASADDGLFFGLTPAAVVLGLVVSTIGLALLRYAKVTLQFPVAIAGLVLMALPFFVTNAVALGVVCALAVVGLVVVVKSAG